LPIAFMKKIYRLDIEGKHRDRLLEAAKHDIRKYMKRERAKPLAAGFDYLYFACRLGIEEADARVEHPAEIIDAIDVLAKQGAAQFFVEVLAKPAQRLFEARPDAESTPPAAAEGEPPSP
jgi:Family of unknown function (DUF6172)